MNHFSGYVKLTHIYNPGWDYLDKRRYVGQFRVLSRKHINTDPKHEESYGIYGMLFTVKVPRSLRHARSGTREWETIAKVLMYEFSRGCRHEHDCCGCFNGGAWGGTLRRTKPGEFTIFAKYYMNI